MARFLTPLPNNNGKIHPSARIRNIQKTAGGSSGELDKHIPAHLAMNSLNISNSHTIKFCYCNSEFWFHVFVVPIV